jgi:tryptophan synthase alpha chain
LNRIDEKFQQLREEGKCGFIPFITAGDPTLEDTRKLIIEFESQGADIVEVGVPFSDPLADGPIIQASSLRALKNGVSLRKVLGLVEDLRSFTKIPIVLLTYYNPVYNYGITNFVKDAKRCGVDGVIIPDLPPEEADDLRREADDAELATIFLVAPTSTPKRIKLIAEASTGFIYYVSVTGTTGIRERLEEIKPQLRLIRSITKKPIGVGFGISKREHIQRVATLADAVIVGSAIVKRISDASSREDLVEEVGKFLSNLIGRD